MSLQVDIRKKYKGFTLETQFDSTGDMLGILGASGSGKSLTLQCIAGIETPDEGMIVANGNVLFDSAAKINVKPQQRKVGYLFQNYALFPHMTVEQNIACVLKGGGKEKKVQTTALLKRFELDELGSRYPWQISGGQQQRTALVRILAYEPEVLLLDEPFSALDAHMREKMQMEMMQLLCEAYFGDMVLVSHNRDEVYRLCENLLVLDDGRALALAPTKSLFHNPGILQVARLTGCKNVSRAVKVGANTVEALDWEVRLLVEGEVKDSITHIGVRAHDFKPAVQGAVNSIPVRQHKSMENPFEWSVLFQNGKTKKSGHDIWWIYSKAQGITEMPNYLSVLPKDVLLLEDI